MSNKLRQLTVICNISTILLAKLQLLTSKIEMLPWDKRRYNITCNYYQLNVNVTDVARWLNLEIIS